MADTTSVAIDLREILDLFDDLHTQAINDSNDHSMPGGEAMVSLGPVASIEAREHTFETAERLWAERVKAGVATSGDRPANEDYDDEAPALQLLLFWSEAWRREHGYELDRRPTVASEAHFLRWCLNWAWENELHWNNFVEDVHDARSNLEAILLAGKRDVRGVQCLSCDATLRRYSRDPREPHFCNGHDGVCGWPHRYCPHDRGGLVDEYRCPSCGRLYTVEEYVRAVKQMHVAHAEWLTLEECSARTGVKEGTIKVWATRGKVAKRKDQHSGRMTYRVPDVVSQAADDDAA
jgi:hypothetical protein